MLGSDAGEPNEVCGAEAAEEKAAQEFKQRTEAGAGASDIKAVEEQVHFLTLVMTDCSSVTLAIRAAHFRQYCNAPAMT